MPRRNLYVLIFLTVACLACAMKVSRYGRVLAFAMDEIRHRSLKEVDQRELFQGALNGMMERLDRYSSYMPPKTADEFNQTMDQQFGGVGIEVLLDPKTEQLTVASPLVGTPAYRGGIRAGDKIVKIDDKSTQGMSLADAVERMRGKPGDPIRLTVLHPDATEPEEIEIIRDVIRVDTVLGDTRNADGSWNLFLEGHDRIGYLRINSFGKQTEGELEEALKWLAENEMRALVLDLRNNPGGLLPAAIGTCNLFIESGTIVSIRRRDPEQIDDVFQASPENTFAGFPMVVLVNGYSASASEIVAACLQDHARAAVVGTRSYGKGTVQELISLQSGQGMLKLTTSSYWRPSNKNIHHHEDDGDEDDWGVKPNEGLEVELDESETAKLAVWRRNRDIYRVHGEDGPPGEESPSEPYFDPQLKKAVEHLQQQLDGAP